MPKRHFEPRLGDIRNTRRGSEWLRRMVDACDEIASGNKQAMTEVVEEMEGSYELDRQGLRDSRRDK